MTDQAPIRSTEVQVAHHCLNELLRIHQSHPDQAVAVADAFLEATVPAWPDLAPLYGSAQAEADWWAECASGAMVSAMLSACLKRLAMGQMIMAPNARKRALVAIWNSLSPEDRTAFLDFIEPGPGARA